MGTARSASARRIAGRPPTGRLTTGGLVAALVLGLVAGCPRQGIVDDGTSISYGPSNRGKLIKSVRLPRRGQGYWTPPRWAMRGLRYGTDELVTLVVYLGRRLDMEERANANVSSLQPPGSRGAPTLARNAKTSPVRRTGRKSFTAQRIGAEAFPYRRAGGHGVPGRGVGAEVFPRPVGPILGVADLSWGRGGPSPWHRSHQTGRDVDLLLFATDAEGRPLVLDRMVKYGPEGQAVIITGGFDDPRTPFNEAERRIYFDVERNWRLVRALIDNPVAPVQYIFIADWLKQKLIEHAIAAGEPAALVEKAGHLMHQPGDAPPHNDHMHVRVYCAATDRVHGCRDRGILRWTKKGYKYGPVAHVTTAVTRSAVATATPAPMPAMLVLGSFPFRP
ncbi:penicillin-insensitive murein endopeptidase [Haliangium sp.]|uniref:penicillin-insensitive murein endopeptidase n=1 Tax=Haliangium sp. TaxID=2663208 RepID=UPI003D0BBEC4